jgi:hypothetical protein
MGKKQRVQDEPSAPSIVISPPSKRRRAVWSDQDERILLEYLIDHKAEAGDGCSFKQTTWQGVVKALEKVPSQGAPKDVNACTSKFKKVRFLPCPVFLLTWRII